MQYSRYGIYFTPPDGPFAAAGAAWLGWDIATGKPCTPVAGSLSARPRKYGFHATLKAPFCLAPGAKAEGLATSTAALCAELAPVALSGLGFRTLGSFLALKPESGIAEIRALAAQVVIALDPFRAPLTEAERTRKSRPNMSAALRDNLERYGYPHVLDQFNFHMTLTGPLTQSDRGEALARAQKHFQGKIPSLVVLDSLTLVGETTQGFFIKIARFPLGKTVR